MELRQLRYLVSIIDFGSFSRASERLNVVQPALSQQIANLEAELGAPLLVRSTRGVDPTEAGRRFYRRARIILEQIDQAKAEVRSVGLDENFFEPVSVGIPSSTSTMLAVPFVLSVREAYPGIRLRVVEGLSGHLLELLLKGRIDIALQFTADKPTGLSVEHLLDEHLFLVSSDAETEGRPVAFTELAQRPLVLPSSSHAMRTLIDRFCIRNGVVLDCVTEVESLPAIRGLAAAGFASAILPRSALVDPTARGALYTRPIVSPQLSRPLSICQLEGTRRHRAMELVTEALRTLIARLVDDGTWTGVTPVAGIGEGSAPGAPA